MNHALSVTAVALGASLAIAGLLSSSDVEGAAGAGAAAGVGAARARSITSVNVIPKTNVNASRDINIDVDNRADYRPVAHAAAVTVAAGAVVSMLPPACSAVVLNGITYHNCGGTWYQPQFAGTQVTYVVVNAPQ